MLLLWVHNHFLDFETNLKMMEYLEDFETLLEQNDKSGQLRMLNYACADKAKARTVTLTRPDRHEPLHFSLMGGSERGFGVFIDRVEKGTKAAEIGLKRGDQVNMQLVKNARYNHGIVALTLAEVACTQGVVTCPPCTVARTPGIVMCTPCTRYSTRQDITVPSVHSR